MDSKKRLHEVSRPIFTVDVFIRSKGKLLLFKRSETKKAFPGWWALPGGHIEEGENPLAAAIREVKEETGIIVSPQNTELKFVAFHNHTDRNELYIVFGFLAVLDGDTPRVGDHSEGKPVWFDNDALSNLENILPPVKHYFDHVLFNKPGIIYNYSTWNNSQLVSIESELVDKNS